MIWIAFTFIVGIALALVAIYEWRIALRIIAPIAVIIALLVGLIAYQSNDEKQHRKANRATQETRQEREKIAPHNPPAKTQNIKDENAEKLRLADERSSTAEAFLASNRSLIEHYFNAASRCHSALIFTGKMEDDAHCQAAIKAKDELQQVTSSLAGISKEDLKRVDSTTMWKIEYADNQMEYAHHLSKRRK
jgi:maleate cis-trans isomerase